MAYVVSRFLMLMASNFESFRGKGDFEDEVTTFIKISLLKAHFVHD
jgi:hypothetical protein